MLLIVMFDGFDVLIVQGKFEKVMFEYRKLVDKVSELICVVLLVMLVVFDVEQFSVRFFEILIELVIVCVLLGENVCVEVVDVMLRLVMVVIV